MMRFIFPLFLAWAFVLLCSSAGCATIPLSPSPQPALTPMPSPAAVKATPTASWVSIQEVEENPEAFRDKLVRMQGHGVIMATVRLCPGYVGLDRRTQFVDAAGDRITAEVQWRPSGAERMYDPDRLRVFEGFIRIFSGEIGCPGAIQMETFPYFEITRVE
ncbi:MAG: hypothetical protein RML36_13935 [Anaerolineae bacterium]|nr:hypothetical protein [Anaerolineae bacterium]MDW8100577.1 hypothetical protein [Anaerolineae bacterium]